MAALVTGAIDRAAHVDMVDDDRRGRNGYGASAYQSGRHRRGREGDRQGFWRKFSAACSAPALRLKPQLLRRQ